MNVELTETTGTEKVLNFLKVAGALCCVGLACNGMVIKGKQGAELAGAMKTCFENTTKHTADVNDVIAWASKGR